MAADSAGTHRAEALQTLVIPTGHPGAGPGVRHTGFCIPILALWSGGSEISGAAGGFGQGIGQRCPLGSITGGGAAEQVLVRADLEES